MDGLHILLIALLGAVPSRQDWVSGSAFELTVNPGDNITLYCDCKKSTGVYIVWYKNCSHENQPALVLGSKEFYRDPPKLPPRFHFMENKSSGSYDLLIMNTTESDEGLYYCGSESSTVEDERFITHKTLYTYGNATRIRLNPSEPHHQTPCDCSLCWTLLFSLCPASAVLSSVLSSLLVCHFCQKRAKENYAVQSSNTSQARSKQDEDVCYAALEIHQASQRPKKKKPQSSDFSTYSAVKTHNT